MSKFLAVSVHPVGKFYFVVIIIVVEVKVCHFALYLRCELALLLIILEQSITEHFSDHSWHGDKICNVSGFPAVCVSASMLVL